MKVYTKLYRKSRTHRPQKIKDLLGRTIALIGKCGFIFYSPDDLCDQPCSQPTCPFHKKAEK